MINVAEIITTVNSGNITLLRHPIYLSLEEDWRKWRLTYAAGEPFIEEYLKRFSKREGIRDFRLRKEFTPIPAFAKGAINEIKNAIYQRTNDVAREGGPNSYVRACLGQLGGVDLKGANMNWYIGHNIITELLVMKRIGVYVDNQIIGYSIADKGNKHPYFCTYKTEDILCWDESMVNDSKQYTDLLLREYYYEKDKTYNLSVEQKQRYKHIYLNNDGYVSVQYYNEQGQPLTDASALAITTIPFHCFEINDSLIKDVANHQIALLNLESSDMSFALLSNFPFYTEQYDSTMNNKYIRAAQEAMNATNASDAEESCDDTGNGEADESISVGSAQGRKYGKGLERPGFINPSPEPLRASMEKEKQLKDDVRTLVHLALSNMSPRTASAEAKALDQHGLEAGLSYIGLELEHGERQLAKYWSMYEQSTAVPTVHYPKRYSLKSDKEQREEVTELEKIRDSVPSLTFQKEVTKSIATILLGTKVADTILAKIHKEIDSADTISSDLEVLIKDHEAGFVSTETASRARMYKQGEVEKAKKDHAERIARIQEAQAPDPSARGIKDLGVNKDASKKEKQGKQGRGPAPTGSQNGR